MDITVLLAGQFEQSNTDFDMLTSASLYYGRQAHQPMNRCLPASWELPFFLQLFHEFLEVLVVTLVG